MSVLRGQAASLFTPVPSRVLRTIDGHLSARTRAHFRADHRDYPNHFRIARMNRNRKSETRRHATRNIFPVVPAIFGPVDAAMILLEKTIRHARRHYDLVDALAQFRRLALAVGHEVGARIFVARPP